MASKTLETLEIPTAKMWRAWLGDHHESSPGVWLVFNRKHTGRPSIRYEDALDAALCFGWIDSLIKRIDDSTYARKFTPRKPDSRWSAVNRKKYEALRAAGRLTPAGLGRPPTDRTYDAPPSRSYSRVPAYIEDSLRKHPQAWRSFESLAPSHRQAYILWIDTAKREETRARRLAESIRLLSEGRKLGLK